MVFDSKEARFGALGLVTCLLCSTACAGPEDHKSGSGSGATGGTAMGQGGTSASGGASTSGGSAGTSSAGSGGMEPAPTSDVLPALPALTNVQVTPGQGSFTITFDPVEGAADYRAYALPKDEDVVLDAGDATKLVAIQNAVYRCAGTHEAADIAKDSGLDPHYNNCETFAVIDSSQPYTDHCGTGSNCYPTAGGIGNGFGEGGYARKPSEIQLGYVYTTPGDGRTAVKAFGDLAADAYYDCNGHQWDASRNKRYSADPEEWAELLSSGWFDLGVVFYAPTGSQGTQQVHSTSLPGTGTSSRFYYYLAGDEHSFRSQAGQSITAAFSTLSAEPAPNADGSPAALPLYRVLYSLGFSGSQHDELAVGKDRFDNLYGQGQKQKNFSITYSFSGTAPESVVVEALDQGCPFQGNLADKSLPATDLFSEWKTKDEILAAAEHGELYLNGHYEGTSPAPIARAYVTLPQAEAKSLDFATDFGGSPEVFNQSQPSCDADNFGCDAGTLRTFESERFDVTVNGIDGERFALFGVEGQLWALYSDLGADVGAYLRMTAKAPATLSADSYLYVSMDVNSMSSARRYPQIILHDELDTPAWISTRNGTAKAIVLQVFGNWPSTLQVEICNQRPWAVNDQCPAYDMLRTAPGRVAPVFEVADQAGEDRLNRFELYASTSRAYVFFDGRPYGCVDYDPASVPSGDVKVTFGDVVYHTGVDDEFVYVLPDGFHKAHKFTLGERRFGGMGFANGVAAPAWDEALMPCATELQ